MAKIIDEIQTRLVEAQKRLAETTQALQTAQQAHQIATQNFNVWNMALQIEQREEQSRQAKATEKQLQLPTASPKPEPVVASVAAASVTTSMLSEQLGDNSEAPNKTDIVRNLLKQHPTGMSAVDIWKAVGEQFNHRPYLYSVLKRLRDRQEIVKRRSKYCLTNIPKTAEGKEQPVVH
jgi:hypothetical protein